MNLQRIWNEGPVVIYTLCHLLFCQLVVVLITSHLYTVSSNWELNWAASGERQTVRKGIEKEKKKQANRFVMMKGSDKNGMALSLSLSLPAAAILKPQKHGNNNNNNSNSFHGPG